MSTVREHTFVICAYEESPFLEECIQSLFRQTVGSELIMVTSTLNGYISNLADKYEIPLRINTGDKGIVQDWNFAYKQADTKYITIAHQDDIYSKYYTETMLKEMKQAERPLIGFTDYAEIRQGKIVKNNTMLKIKRLMLLPLTLRYLQKSKPVRRRILSFGCPICCPSVTFYKENLPDTIFQVGYRSDEDWQAWEKLSRLKGDFVYCSRILTYHRIHEKSATTSIIGDRVRSKEDYEMFRRFWPEFIAKGLVKFYSKSEKSNSMTSGSKI
ncbi:glycosyltransferase [Anaerocolumna sedimenticola]|uniref:Glycosyltransferase n=1 Tax=Anaerocolumna sedimenticola TaxID=2696063 RepID=A0A6P1TLT0_9FIRM|nr:glycosyltransferase family A protein [Anaerocolumna sedimenticola]QHQ61129.1 glycosyltransferase [Anaerocolumna sedimenticola]